ncbi:MAG: alpha/beta fold hydrolase [Pseudomonadota bacterium]
MTSKRPSLFAVWLVIVLCLDGRVAAENADPAHYGQLPYARSVSVSPDGRHIAYIRRDGDADYLVVARTADLSVIGGAQARKTKARHVLFATNRHVVVSLSQTVRSPRVYNQWEHSGLSVLDIQTGEQISLLKDWRKLYPAQTDIGRVVGVNASKGELYFPAYVGKRNPSFNLLRAGLDGQPAAIHARGTEHTIDWYVDAEGRVLAKEEFDEQRKEHSLHVRRDTGWSQVYVEVGEQPSAAFGAVSADGAQLYFSRDTEIGDEVYALSLSDGEVNGPLFDTKGDEIDRLLVKDRGRELHGIQFSGLLPSYQFIDTHYQQFHQSVQLAYPQSTVVPVSASQDGIKQVFLVSGNEAAGDYVLLDTRTRELDVIASQYPDIPRQLIGDIKVVRFKTHDGLSIEAVVTWPLETDRKSNLPMIVLPHRGDGFYDFVRFDWMAQYFARKGYVVFQPNYRGSSGRGKDFRQAGYGEWARAVQHDIADGVDAMIAAGHADETRICIVGTSLGGFLALTAATASPERYRCVVSIAGVTDLPRLLFDIERQFGEHSLALREWHRRLGDLAHNHALQVASSPVSSAPTFPAPVLLVHGDDDSVVLPNQSARLYKALKKHEKPVELVKLRDEDHWLSNNDTRLAMLKHVSRFIETHNPPNR